MNGRVWTKGGMVMTGEKPKYWGKETCPTATFPTKTPTWIGLETNPRLRGHRSATHRLIHDTALAVVRTTIIRAVVLHQLDNAR